MTSRQNDFDPDDDFDEEASYLIEVTPKDQQFGLVAASNALPRLMIEQATTAGELGVFRKAPGIVAVVEAPGAAWVKPLLQAAKTMAHWDLHLSESAKQKAGADNSRDQAIHAVDRGHRILGVSQNPSGYLPEGLAGSADMTVKVNLPDDTVIRRTIRAATGRYPKTMPKDIARGLSYTDICLAIRKGSKPAECVTRLIAAGQAASRQDDDLSQVPPLASLYGYGEAMVWARGLVADLDAWRRGEIDFSALQRTVVLASEPGMGKSTFVRSLARAAGVPLVATSVSTWFSNSTGYLDGVIKQIDQVFLGAAANAPAIVFLDEIESIPDRAQLTARAAEWWMPVVGHMLLTLDSASSGVSSRLIVIGATNFPEKLDSALTRPGRLSRIIWIGRPDKAALAGILRQHLGDDLAGVDLSEVAALGWGASGADVTEWVKLARSVARKAERPMAIADLLAQVAPPEDRPDDLALRIAAHEAGHAVVLQVLGLSEVTAVSSIGAGPSGGRTVIGAMPDVMSREQVDGYVTFLLAGRCAEEVIVGSASSGSGGSTKSDLAHATNLLASAYASLGMGNELLYRGTPEEVGHMLAINDRLAKAVEAELQRLYADAKAIVTEYRAAVQAVALALIRERYIDGDRFREIFLRHSPGSRTIEMDGRDG
ncbi:Peptidase family M41 [Devosia lucknowensis]|uniref:Peptidase family M41 n=1 Tax=Devosia lucknowensis TaxID=1096929 RepID=A0A1Y6G513_9HYPH|nr:AAA family ATPase [Devosia lucknowensis]SMQ85282.1 Peptidase family M41 [Devosia lucknowensis]